MRLDGQFEYGTILEYFNSYAFLSIILKSSIFLTGFLKHNETKYLTIIDNILLCLFHFVSL